MYIQVILSTLVTLSAILQIKAGKDVHSCDSKVYCQGDLLDTVQRLRIYSDSKTFVDMVQKNAEDITLQNFETMMISANNSPSKDDVVTFLEDNFVREDESETWTPPDYKNTPSFLRKIKDTDVQHFAQRLIELWPLLGRRVNDEVHDNSSRHSLIPVPEGFIIPGGRFREIYYWDSYWIIKGLLISEMGITVRGMLNNFIYLIKTYGFIPNGARIYYLNRSQPPLFTSMVGIYLDYTDDTDWLADNIEYIEQELLWWVNNRVVIVTHSGVKYKLAHYGPKSNTPRPESYAEDLRTCAYFAFDEDKRKCYNGLKAGAESGWDFSTRWLFGARGSTNGNLSTIDTPRIIPVDLNALLCKSFKLLASFYTKLKNEDKQSIWTNYYRKWYRNIEMLLYHEQDGIWYDFDMVSNEPRKLFFPSNFVPLWAECYDVLKKDRYGRKATQYFFKHGVERYLGGVPTSLENSGEQWDLPNAWPPLQDYVISGLHKTGNSYATALAEDIARRWIASNMKGMSISGAMYEKYDASEPGIYGGGGEYMVQVGFGWSNGAVLSLIDQFNSARIPKATLNLFNYLVVFSLFTFVGNLICF